MPHRPANPIFFDSDVYAEPTDNGGAMVKLPSDHIKRPNQVIGQIIKNGDNDYTAYTYNIDTDELIIALGRYTSIDCAIARLEYREGRLSTKYNREFACPDCGKTVKTVMVAGPVYPRTIPKLANIDKVMILADTWNKGTYNFVKGITLHECGKEAIATV